MNVDEIISKLTGTEAAKTALGEDVLAAITSTLTKAGDFEKKLKDAEAKAGRILSEKKEAQEKLSALEADVENLKKSGMSDADRIKAEYEKALKRAEKAEKDFAQVQADFGKAKRTVALDRLTSQVKFIDAVNPEAGRILLESSLAAIANLEDQEAVTAALSAFKESHKTLIAADSQATGAGTGRPGGSAQGSGNGPAIDKMTAEERAADLKKIGILR